MILEDEDRTRSSTNDPLRDAAHEEVVEAAAAMGAKDQEITSMLAGRTVYLRERITLAEQKFNGDAGLGGQLSAKPGLEFANVNFGLAILGNLVVTQLFGAEAVGYVKQEDGGPELPSQVDADGHGGRRVLGKVGRTEDFLGVKHGIPRRMWWDDGRAST
jgi:hypothetical protein